MYRGTVCYDRDCSLCRALAARWARRLRKRGLHLAALQDPAVLECLGLAEVPDEIKLITASGRVLGGAEAMVAIAVDLGLVGPFGRACRLPPVAALLKRSYRWIAAHRHCAGGTCRLPAHR
jgi:predicted DCC family thiol-disulfide oxidoreductase YuxK